eukprot:867301_1
MFVLSQETPKHTITTMKSEDTQDFVNKTVKINTSKEQLNSSAQGSAVTQTTSIRVPTFRNEAQTSETKSLVATRLPQDARANIANASPFLYFSGNKRRLEYLLGRQLPHIPQDEEPAECKRRISFELDPFHDIMSEYPQLLDEDNWKSFDDEHVDGPLNDAK